MLNLYRMGTQNSETATAYDYSEELWELRQSENGKYLKSVVDVGIWNQNSEK